MPSEVLPCPAPTPLRKPDQRRQDDRCEQGVPGSGVFYPSEDEHQENLPVPTVRGPLGGRSQLDHPLAQPCASDPSNLDPMMR